MGMEIVVLRTARFELVGLLSALAAKGLPSTIVMVDNALHPPTAEPPVGWRDVRLKTPAGMVSLKRRDDGIALVVFGNADAALESAQQQIAEALRAIP